MTRLELMWSLKEFTKQVTKDLLLPVRPTEEDEDPDKRPAEVFLMRLPDRYAYVRRAPYILHQLVNTMDKFKDGDGPRGASAKAMVRSVFCVYAEEDSQEDGGMALLDLMERFRMGLLEAGWIGRGKMQFSLDIREGVECTVYPDQGPPTSGSWPYLIGEVLTTWDCPRTERKIDYGKKGYAGTGAASPVGQPYSSRTHYPG